MKDYALNTGTVLHGSNYDYTIERVLGNGTLTGIINYLGKEDYSKENSILILRPSILRKILQKL